MITTSLLSSLTPAWIIAAGLIASGCAGGAGDLGAPCSRPGSCPGGLVCVGSPPVCQEPGRAGDPCWSDDSNGCAPGFVCSGGRCITPHSLPADSACAYNIDCAGGLICNWAASPARCMTPRTFGERCKNDTDCAPALQCPQSLFGPRTCQCGACPEGVVCGAEACIEPASVPEGEACAHNSGCQEGLVCVWAALPYLCEPPRQEGEPCGHPSDCIAGTSCSPMESICRPTCTRDEGCEDGSVCLRSAAGLFPPERSVCGVPGAEGAPCGAADHCVEGLACVKQVCAPPIPTGAACQSAEACAMGDWCPRDTRVCTPDRGEGEVCDLPTTPSNAACQDGLSCRPACGQDPDDPLSGRCQPVLDEGAACTPCTSAESPICGVVPALCDGGCRAGLTCAQGPHGERVCQPQAL